MALVADQFDAFPTGAATPSATGNLADAAKQATKALKCVAFTTKQVGELLARKHERVLKRIGAISEEIESLKQDVMENITHQRERRTQLSEIEEDLEHAQLLGNGAVVESLYEELHVMKEETKREESLYRALCKTVRSRKESKKQFQQERLLVEEEIRTFAQKQKLIQTLLATCSKQSAGVDYTLASSASQSDCGASVLDDSDEEDEDADHAHDDTASRDGASSSSSGSFPENPLLDSPPLRAMDPPAAVRKEKVLAKAVSLMETGGGRSTSPKRLRVRSWSSDCVQPVPAATRDSVQTRTRHSLSVHFASPVLTVSTIKTNDEELDKELESLDLSHYLGSINETAASPSAYDEAVRATSAIAEEDETATFTQPEELVLEHNAVEETTAAPAHEAVVAEVVQKLVIQTEASGDSTSSTKNEVVSTVAPSNVPETVATDALSVTPASATNATLAA